MFSKLALDGRRPAIQAPLSRRFAWTRPAARGTVERAPTVAGFFASLLDDAATSQRSPRLARHDGHHTLLSSGRDPVKID